MMLMTDMPSSLSSKEIVNYPSAFLCLLLGKLRSTGLCDRATHAN